MTFTFDGREIEGVAGEPLAASLLAADRPILSRSFRFHMPRGLMCSTGQCGWCECEVDGRASERSCRVPVRAGLVVRGEHAWPSVERDLLSLLEIGSRWIPPTFYHHRFLRPRRLRKRYLDVLRWFGGRGRLRVDGQAAPPGRPTETIETDVLVVGGGRAGLLAALGAAEGGRRVVLVEAEPALGGAWRLDLADQGRQPATADLVRSAEAAGVGILTGVAATGWYEGVVMALGSRVAYEIRAGVVVAATGSYERVPLVPGADRPGVMGARAVSWLVARHGILAGERILLVGEGRELVDAGDRLRRAGAATIIGPVPTIDLLAVRGRRRVSGAEIRVGGQARRVSVDVVAFGDRSPNLDFVLAAGGVAASKEATIGPVSDESGRLTGSAHFVVGSAAGRPIESPQAAEAARRTGAAAATLAHARGRPDETGSDRARQPQAVTGPGRDSARDVPRIRGSAVVCFCEDVRVWEIRAEQAAGYADPELLKRRTGALTGPCQGKYCAQSFALLTCPSDGHVTMPTARPPLRPTRLGDLIDEAIADLPGTTPG